MSYQGHRTMSHGAPGLMPLPQGMFPAPHQPPPYPPPPMMMGMPPNIGQHMAPGMLGMHPHMHRGMPPPMMVVGHPITSADPIVKVPIPASTANMKVATTVFVGNISERASDTLIRQILLRCGPIDGWKRVQDATGKLQGFGFCEYADPDSTLRALRLLDKLKLGEKALVAKVDAKTRKELLKYLITKKYMKRNRVVSESEVDQEVSKLEEDKDVATAALITEVQDDAKSEDDRIRSSINTVLKDYLSILSCNKSNEDIQRERDVKESILFMAKQSGNLDPDSTLEDMDMEDEVKTLVSDEIKRFRESYKRSDEARKDKKSHDKDYTKDRDRGHDNKDPDTERDRDEDRLGRSKVETSTDTPQAKGKYKRDRSHSPAKRDKRDISPPTRRGRSPMRSRSQERQEKEKRREAMRQREKEEVVKEESDYEERMRQRRIKERDRAYKQRLANWEGREYRKGKENEKETKREKERKEDVEREKKHLGDFLAEYDDDKDDQKYYRGSAYGRRRREREVEMDCDERDRIREKDELEELRLQVIERQAREILSGDPDRDGSGEESPSRAEGDDEEEDIDVPVKEEIEEDIPLAKSGYAVPPTYPPIQVHSAPSVDNSSSGFVPVPADSTPVPPTSIMLRGVNNSEVKQEHSEGNSPAASYNSPTQGKLAFGLKKTSAPTPSQAGVAVSTGQAKSTKMEKIFTSEEEEVEKKPKKKLVPIDYSDEEGEEEEGEESDSRRKRSHRSSGKSSSSSRRHHDVGIVSRGSSSLSSGDGLMMEEIPKDRKLTSDERKRMTQTLVNSIPTTKEEVFQYQLKWDQIDKALIEKRVDPWINKKIAEYIGEPEPILTEFICNKLSCHISPDDILNDISMVLDDEAEVFILKLWRLLIYETEAKHLGIAKSYY